MSHGNVSSEDVVRAAVDAINREDLDAYLELMHPEVEFTSMIAEAEGETFRGHEGARRWWKVVRTAFTEVRWDFVIVEARADRGVAKLHIEGTLGGVAVAQTMWQAGVLRDGKAIWFGFFRTEAEALAAVGLAE